MIDLRQYRNFSSLMIFYHIRIDQLWMILITFVHLLTFVVIFDESTLLVNKICKILFSEFFCEKKQDFYLLETKFQRVKHSARSSKAFDEY